MNVRNIALKAGFAAAIMLAATGASFAASAVATGGVNVRQGPGTQYRVVDQLYRGERVDVQGCTGGFCRITHSGPDGWVSANYLSRGNGYRDYDDYDGPGFTIRPRPHYSRPFYPRRPHGFYPRSNSFCFGGQNAQFCLSN